MRSPPFAWARLGALALTAIVAAAPGCKTASTGAAPPAKSARIEVDDAGLVAALVQKHGQSSRDRAERGVRQLVAYWRPQDGDGAALRAFVEQGFVADPQEFDALHRRFSAALGQIDRHMLEVGRALRRWDEAGPRSPIGGGQLFCARDRRAHLPG